MTFDDLPLNAVFRFVYMQGELGDFRKSSQDTYAEVGHNGVLGPAETIGAPSATVRQVADLYTGAAGISLRAHFGDKVDHEQALLLALEFINSHPLAAHWNDFLRSRKVQS